MVIPKTTTKPYLKKKYKENKIMHIQGFSVVFKIYNDFKF